jgi:hypothetical protein
MMLVDDSDFRSINMHEHELVGLFHLGHGVGCQTQLLSDKGFSEHLGSVPSYFLAGNRKLTDAGVPFKSLSGRKPKQFNSFKCDYTFRGTNGARYAGCALART